MKGTRPSSGIDSLVYAGGRLLLLLKLHASLNFVAPMLKVGLSQDAA
jgi:hypothetical protein